MDNVTVLLCSYPLAKKSDEFITSVVSGYDVVPRLTIRGIGHVVMSIADLIHNTSHSKQKILCCSGRCGWEPDIDVDVIEARQEANLNELKLPNVEPNKDHKHSGDDSNSTKKEVKFGMELLKKQLAVLMSKEDRIRASNEKSGVPMIFTPGKLIHMEVVEVDQIKMLVQ